MFRLTFYFLFFITLIPHNNNILDDLYMDVHKALTSQAAYAPLSPPSNQSHPSDLSYPSGSSLLFQTESSENVEIDPGSLEDLVGKEAQNIITKQHNNVHLPTQNERYTEEPITSLNSFQMKEIRLTDQMNHMIWNVSLGDIHDQMNEDCCTHLRNPPQGQLMLDDPNVQLSIDNFLSTLSASQDVYTAVQQNTIQQFPEYKMLSFDQVK
jgi:hypothetical protein